MSRKNILWVLIAAMLAIAPAGFADDDDEIEVEEEDVIEFLEEHLPKEAALLKKVEQEDEEEFDEMMEEWEDWLEGYYFDLEHAPEMARLHLEIQKLEAKSSELVEKIEAAKGASEKKTLTTELKKLLNQIFDLQLKDRELEIKELQKEIDEIKEMVEKRKKNKEKIVDRHMGELLEDDDEDTEWW